MAAVHSPQDVYARHLVSGRGYPLWTPEPNMSLPDTYRQEGLKIGDVGVVVPEDGSFDVFFNVTLPPTHILHQETGVPDNFTPILLGGRDIAVFPEAEGAGRVISTSSVRSTNTADETPERRVEPGLLNYQFTLSSREGAVLILPEGAERCYLRNERPFLEAAMQHAVDWYTFAEQRLGRIISHDSLYLITGFYKTRSWSLAAYQQGAGTDEASAHFKAVHVGRGNIPACYTWETTEAIDWRVGPSNLYYNGIPNQSVFINGFKIAIRDGILGSKWVTVKADIPSVKPYRAEFSGGSLFPNLWSGVLGRTMSNTSKWTGTGLHTDSDPLVGDQPSDSDNEDIMIHRFPQVTKPFHPSDMINQHLLHEMPSATVAVTHDNQWKMLLQNGLLKPDELSRDRLISEVTSNYIPILTNQGAVYLESRAMEVDIADNTKMVTTSSETEGNLDLSPTPCNVQLPDSAPSTADIISVESYACAYGNFTSPGSTHAIYHTMHELQEHVMSAHPHIVGTHVPVFRCGLAGCGQSWEHIEELDNHIRLSHAHHHKVNPEDHANPLTGSPGSRQVPTSATAGRECLEASIQDVGSAEQLRETLPSYYSLGSIFPRAQSTEPNETKDNKLRTRILQACYPCRARKVKCDGVHPTCGHCRRRSSPCVYTDIKGKGKEGAESSSKLSLPSTALKESPSKDWSFRTSLASYMNTHSRAKPYKCIAANCKRSFALRSNAIRHLRAVHGINLSSRDLPISEPPEEPMIRQAQDVAQLHPSKYRRIPNDLLPHKYERLHRAPSPAVQGASRSATTLPTSASPKISSTSSLSACSDDGYASPASPNTPDGTQLPLYGYTDKFPDAYPSYRAHTHRGISPVSI